MSGMAGGTGLLTIQLKNADGITADEQLRDLDPDTSVLEVKQLLQACYPGQPPSASQKIVFAGRCDSAAGADWARACTPAWPLADGTATGRSAYSAGCVCRLLKDADILDQVIHVRACTSCTAQVGRWLRGRTVCSVGGKPGWVLDWGSSINTEH